MIYELYKKQLVLRTLSKRKLNKYIKLLKDKGIDFEEVEVLECSVDDLIPDNPINLRDTLGTFGKKHKI